MKRVIVYTRYSPRRNAEESQSCETQLAYCEQWAFKNGLPVAGRYRDEAVSGSDEDRPGMWAAIDALGKGDTLLVYKLDRLARNVYLMECVRRAVEVKGGVIAAVEGDVEGNGPEAVMIRQVLSSISEYERKIIALRTKYAMLHHQRQGRRMGKNIPYGWSLDPNDEKRMIPNEAERKAIEAVFELRAGGATQDEIVAALNEKYADAARVGKWNQKTVSKLLRRERFEEANA